MTPYNSNITHQQHQLHTNNAASQAQQQAAQQSTGMPSSYRHPVQISQNIYGPMQQGIYISPQVPIMHSTIPNNVFVNNVTANVNLHGYLAHSVPQFLPHQTTRFIPTEVPQNLPSQRTDKDFNLGVNQSISNSKVIGTNRDRINNNNDAKSIPEQSPNQINAISQGSVHSEHNHQSQSGSEFWPYMIYSPHYYEANVQNATHTHFPNVAPTLYVTNHMPYFSSPTLCNYPPNGYIYQTIPHDVGYQKRNDGFQNISDETIDWKYTQGIVNDEVSEVCGDFSALNVMQSSTAIASGAHLYAEMPENIDRLNEMRISQELFTCERSGKEAIADTVASNGQQSFEVAELHNFSSNSLGAATDSIDILLNNNKEVGANDRTTNKNTGGTAASKSKVIINAEVYSKGLNNEFNMTYCHDADRTAERFCGPNNNMLKRGRNSVLPYSQKKKTMASVAVTAIPSEKQQITETIAESREDAEQSPLPHSKQNYTPPKNQIKDSNKICQSIAETSKNRIIEPNGDKLDSKELSKRETDTHISKNLTKDSCETACTSVESTAISATSWAGLFNPKAKVNPSCSSFENLLPPEKIKKPVAKVLPFEGTVNLSPKSKNSKFPQASPLLERKGSSFAESLLRTSDSNEKIDCKNYKNCDQEFSYKLACFLPKYKIDFTAVSLRPRGLTNRSNYCYINATLQALIGCPPFYNLINAIPKKYKIGADNEKTPTINAMIDLVSSYNQLPEVTKLFGKFKNHQKNEEEASVISCDSAIEPTGLYKLWNLTRCDVEGRQEDAEEFLSYVLNKLNDEMLETIKLAPNKSSETPSEGEGDDWQMIYNNKNKGSITRQTDFGRTPLTEIFRGELRSRIQREGEHATDVIQPFFTLQLNIEKASSVKEAFEIMVGRDQLEGVTGSKTNQEVVAWQQMTIEKLPYVLILHLKCFNYKLDGCTKILKTVEFPLELKIDTKILASNKYSQKQRIYRLYAVVYHDGKDATKGHYITDVYHPGYLCWLRYDDSSVKPVSEYQVLRPRTPRVPYLLYYIRCDTIPVPRHDRVINCSKKKSSGNSSNNLKIRSNSHSGK